MVTAYNLNNECCNYYFRRHFYLIQPRRTFSFPFLKNFSGYFLQFFNLNIATTYTIFLYFICVYLKMETHLLVEKCRMAILDSTFIEYNHADHSLLFPYCYFLILFSSVFNLNIATSFTLFVVLFMCLFENVNTL